MKSGAVQRRLIFRGQVQGVGFRFTACRIADRLPVTGFVRNRPDGSVELVAEGLAADLDRLFAELSEEMSGYISDVETIESPATGQFIGFDVRR